MSQRPCVCNDTVWVVPKSLVQEGFAEALECPLHGPYLVADIPEGDPVIPEVNHQQSVYGRVILAALSNQAFHVYAGTVPAAVVARRRAKNRVARRSRRANR